MWDFFILQTLLTVNRIKIPPKLRIQLFAKIFLSFKECCLSSKPIIMTGLLDRQYDSIISRYLHVFKSLKVFETKNCFVYRNWPRTSAASGLKVNSASSTRMRISSISELRCSIFQLWWVSIKLSHTTITFKLFFYILLLLICIHYQIGITIKLIELSPT